MDMYSFQPSTIKRPQPGLLESILILDLLLPLFTWVVAIGSGENGAGIGILMGLVVIPLWLLCSIPVIALAVYGVYSASRMTDAGKLFRQIVSYAVIIERIVISTILIFALLGAFQG